MTASGGSKKSFSILIHSLKTEAVLSINPYYIRSSYQFTFRVFNLGFIS